MRRLETDVATIGAGPAGLAAAIRAAESGCNVIILEKGSTTGGTANMGMGPFAVESRLQKLKQVPLTKEQAFKIFMDYTHWRVDARIVREYIERSSHTIEWLERMGVEFFEPAAYFPGAHYTWHIVKPKEGKPAPQCASTMTRIMTQRAKELGVKIYLNTSAKRLLKEGERIKGVQAEDKEEEEYEIVSKAVIIATGGFGDNPEWIKEYTGYEWGKDFFSFRVPGLVGDGIRMAWEVGAARTEMNMEIIYGIPGIDEFPVLRAIFRQPNLVVNLQGERFMNEEILINTTFTGNAIARQKGRCAFVLFDEEIKEHYMKNGLDFISYVFPVFTIENFEVEWEEAIKRGIDHLFVASSIEELAEKTGIDYEGLKNTIEEYNRACSKGVDALFYKNPRYLRPLVKPKFYAARNFPGAYGSLGGIKVNYKMEVLKEDWSVIKGLYACGTDACSIYGDSYVFVLPGNTMGFALNSGYIAGESAAQYVKTL